jgi:hypothetical protein
MAVDHAQIDCPARPASREEYIEHGVSGDQRGPDGGRPQHVAADGQAPIPAVRRRTPPLAPTKCARISAWLIFIPEPNRQRNFLS